MAFVRQDFADRIQLADHRAALAPKPVFGAQAQHLADLTSPLHAGAFEILDRQAAAAGVELRFPFWDKDFAEFCLNLPAEWKLDGGWSRLVLRKAMEGRLPPEVQWRRTKLDFKPHFALGMLAHHTALIEDVIFKDSGQIGTYADLEALAAAYHRMKTLREKTPLSDLAGIYRAVVLSEWNRKLL
jgi:asparagine synthase (glutamine-hydrolysing)